MRYLPLVAVLSILGCSTEPSAPSGSNNRSPVIDSVVVAGAVFVGIPVDVTCYAHDPDGDTLLYFWRVADGNIVGNGRTVQFLPAPCCSGNSTTMQVIVRDRHNASASREFSIFVWQ
ncbi:MAG: hypothetical protein N2663_01640 [Chlorobi bacterium]|nr:hypothetical protein [Chlorobiota bacterium]